MIKQPIILNKNRHRLYREHKYIFHVFTELLRFASTLDLSNKSSQLKLKSEIINLELLLHAHAEYEESRIHKILKNKNSSLVGEAEVQHQEQKQFFVTLNEKINLIESVNNEEIHLLSYEIYLDLRNFFGENLRHFAYEEQVIMPELQRLCSDDEIREVDNISYRQMLPEQMVDMMKVLFPHMNFEDRFTFLNDIKECEPGKFRLAWDEISSSIEGTERDNLIRALNI